MYNCKCCVYKSRLRIIPLCGLRVALSFAGTQRPPPPSTTIHHNNNTTLYFRHGPYYRVPIRAFIILCVLYAWLYYYNPFFIRDFIIIFYAIRINVFQRSRETIMSTWWYKRPQSSESVDGQSPSKEINKCKF